MAYETNYTLLEQVIQMLTANKDNKFSRVIEIIVNEAMKLERAQALQAEPYERTDERSVFHIPENHRRKMRTSNLAERQMKEIKRRTRVVGVFPNSESLLRLAATLLIEQNDQWQNEKRYLPESKDRPALNEIYRKKVA